MHAKRLRAATILLAKCVSATSDAILEVNIWSPFLCDALEWDSLKFSGLGKRRSQTLTTGKNKKFKRNAWENAKLRQLINPKISLIHNLLFAVSMELISREFRSILPFCFVSCYFGFVIMETCNYVGNLSSSDVSGVCFFHCSHSNRALDISIRTRETMRVQQRETWLFWTRRSAIRHQARTS